MTEEDKSFDPTWEEAIYGKGRHLNRYPYDSVVSFVFNYRPQEKSREATKILEVGCGAGNNLWFAAREGFLVTGIDGSASAIAYAQQRFKQEGLCGDLRVGDFTALPFESDSFDLVVDRCAITHTGWSSGQKAVAEIHRVLRNGGRFHFNAFSERHSSYGSGRPGPDDVTIDISAGTLVGVGQTCFYSRRAIYELFADGWNLLSLQHLEDVEMIQPQFLVLAQWLVIAEKRT
ncbi:MAG: class I SAM-dependent methyltransferase [Deltaproteobacteria bacterium]|nr:class I SAM-dependent methyltransferase [Deltaproteobacteria bacterium]